MYNFFKYFLFVVKLYEFHSKKDRNLSIKVFVLYLLTLWIPFNCYLHHRTFLSARGSLLLVGSVPRTYYQRMPSLFSKSVGLLPWNSNQSAFVFPRSCWSRTRCLGSLCECALGLWVSQLSNPRVLRFRASFPVKRRGSRSCFCRSWYHSWSGVYGRCPQDPCWALWRGYRYCPWFLCRGSRPYRQARPGAGREWRTCFEATSNQLGARRYPGSGRQARTWPECPLTSLDLRFLCDLSARTQARVALLVGRHLLPVHQTLNIRQSSFQSTRARHSRCLFMCLVPTEIGYQIFPQDLRRPQSPRSCAFPSVGSRLHWCDLRRRFRRWSHSEYPSSQVLEAQPLAG